MVVQGRLLSYLPSGAPPSPGAGVAAAATKWCGWHTDHGSLTGLTPAYYLEGDDFETEVACPDPAAGLLIETREGGYFKHRSSTEQSQKEPSSEL